MTQQSVPAVTQGDNSTSHVVQAESHTSPHRPTEDDVPKSTLEGEAAPVPDAGTHSEDTQTPSRPPTREDLLRASAILREMERRGEIRPFKVSFPRWIVDGLEVWGGGDGERSRVDGPEADPHGSGGGDNSNNSNSNSNSNNNDNKGDTVVDAEAAHAPCTRARI